MPRPAAPLQAVSRRRPFIGSAPPKPAAHTTPCFRPVVAQVRPVMGRGQATFVRALPNRNKRVAVRPLVAYGKAPALNGRVFQTRIGQKHLAYAFVPRAPLVAAQKPVSLRGSVSLIRRVPKRKLYNKIFQPIVAFQKPIPLRGSATVIKKRWYDHLTFPPMVRGIVYGNPYLVRRGSALVIPRLLRKYVPPRRPVNVLLAQGRAIFFAGKAQIFSPFRFNIPAVRPTLKPALAAQQKPVVGRGYAIVQRLLKNVPAVTTKPVKPVLMGAVKPALRSGSVFIGRMLKRFTGVRRPPIVAQVKPVLYLGRAVYLPLPLRKFVAKRKPVAVLVARPVPPLQAGRAIVLRPNSVKHARTLPRFPLVASQRVNALLRGYAVLLRVPARRGIVRPVRVYSTAYGLRRGSSFISALPAKKSAFGNQLVVVTVGGIADAVGMNAQQDPSVTVGSVTDADTIGGNQA